MKQSTNNSTSINYPPIRPNRHIEKHMFIQPTIFVVVVVCQQLSHQVMQWWQLRTHYIWIAISILNYTFNLWLNIHSYMHMRHKCHPSYVADWVCGACAISTYTIYMVEYACARVRLTIGYSSECLRFCATNYADIWVWKTSPYTICIICQVL